MIARVDGFVGASKGGFSGGTIASGANLLENPQLVVRATPLCGGTVLSGARKLGARASAPARPRPQGNQNAHCLDPEFPEKEDSMGLQLVRHMRGDVSLSPRAPGAC